jgi:teichuronic acid biosynthesis glycosyltransferase TuaG
MPVYNSESFIGCAIDSVILQTYTNWELIIVNDGSTDNTQSIIDKYKCNDSRIISLQQKNGRQGKARNLAISHASGKYLAFLDADDVWIPEKLSLQIKEIEDTNAGLVYSKSYMIDVNKNIMDDIICGHIGYLHGVNGVAKMIEMNQIPILTVLVKKELVDRVNGFSEKLIIANVEDYHLWLKLIMGDVVFCGSDKILAYYRIHENAVTKNDSRFQIRLLYTYSNLCVFFPKYKKLLNRRIKSIFRMQDLFSVKNKKELFRLYLFNCNMLNVKRHNKLILITTKYFPLRVSKTLFNIYLNGFNFNNSTLL